jgi:hypothetical protein
MLNDLIKELKTSIGPQVREQTPLNAEQADRALELGGESVKEVVDGEMKRGNISGLMSMLQGGKSLDQSNPIVMKAGGVFVGKLVEKLNLSPEMARQVEQTVLPLVLQFLNKKKSEGGLGSLLGGGLGGFLKGGLGGLFR